MSTEQDNTPTAATNSNIDPLKEAAFAELREIGRSEGKGKTARLRAAELICRKAREGLLDETDNQRAWEELLTGAGEEMAMVGGGDLRDTQQFKQRSSDIKHFIVLGRNPHLDGPQVLDHAIRRMSHLRSSKLVKSGRIWELMLAFARNQNATPRKPLEDKQIDKVMADKAKGAKKKAIAEKLWEARQRLLDINEGEDIREVYDCCETLEKVVKKLGGTAKQKKQAKEQAKLDKLKAKTKEKPKSKDKTTTTNP
jgi:hypothetical protein